MSCLNINGHNYLVPFDSLKTWQIRRLGVGLVVGGYDDEPIVIGGRYSDVLIYPPSDDFVFSLNNPWRTPRFLVGSLYIKGPTRGTAHLVDLIVKTPTDLLYCSAFDTSRCVMLFGALRHLYCDPLLDYELYLSDGTPVNYSEKFSELVRSDGIELELKN